MSESISSIFVRQLSLIGVFISIAVVVLDAGMFNAVLPMVGTAFPAKVGGVFWIINLYQMVLLASLLLFGVLADFVGQKFVFIGGLIVFLCGSVYGALSENLLALSIARGVQGLGASAMTSVNIALLRLMFSGVRLPYMIGVSTVVVALSSTAAPIVAVELYKIDRWASIFVLDIVLALVAFILIFRGLPAKSAPSTLFCFRTDFLWSGAALVMSSIFIVIGWCGCVESKRSILIVLGLLVCCLLCWVVFKKQAMVSLTCSVGRSSLWCWIVSVLAYAGQASSLVALPFLISGQSESGINEIGWQLALWSGCSGITGPLASYFFNVGRMSAVGLLLSGLVLMFSGMALLASLGMLSLPGAVPVCMVLSGAGFGLFQISNMLILMKSTPLHYSARINSYIAVGRCFGQMVGVATASALFSLDLPSVEFRIFRYSAALVLIALVLAMVSGLNAYPRKK